MTEKRISFTEVGDGLWAFTAEGDPNSGVIIGDDSVMIIEAQATPLLANKVIEKVREVTDKPITHLVLTHYHAVRVLGASAFNVDQIIMSDVARAMVVERGQEDWDSEFQRFSPPVRRAREHPRPDLADHHVLGTDDRLPRKQEGRDQTGRPRPHRRRQRCLGAGRTGHVHRRHRRIPLGLLLRRRAISGTGARLSMRSGHTIRRRLRLAAETALVGREMVAQSLLLTRDFVESTYRPIRQVAARGGSLKDAWDAARDVCEPEIQRLRDLRALACPSMSRARTTRRAESIRPGSGPRRATSRCGSSSRADWDRHMIADRYKLAFRLYPYRRSTDQDAARPVRRPVVVVGGGPIGMAAALDLGLQDIPVVVLDDHEGIGMGSRAICFAQRTLEIAAPLRMRRADDRKGAWSGTWARSFTKTGRCSSSICCPKADTATPRSSISSKPLFEKFLVDRLRAAQADGAPIDLRGRNRLDAIEVREDHILLAIATPEGPYRLEADWLVGCDGASSPLRRMLGLDFEGQVFRDSFLIADIRMKADFPTERWFWFEPSFRSGASTLLHKQPDGIWRVDFQIGWDVGPQGGTQGGKCPPAGWTRCWAPGSGTNWSGPRSTPSSAGGFENFVMAGSSSPATPRTRSRPSARAEPIPESRTSTIWGWKLGLVIRGQAPDRLLDSYDEERIRAADENILNSSRSTDFITPKSKISHIFRNAVLDLAEEHAFARPLVNSGRLSVPCSYHGLSLAGT